MKTKEDMRECIRDRDKLDEAIRTQWNRVNVYSVRSMWRRCLEKVMDKTEKEIREIIGNRKKMDELITMAYETPGLTNCRTNWTRCMKWVVNNGK